MAKSAGPTPSTPQANISGRISSASKVFDSKGSYKGGTALARANDKHSFSVTGKDCLSCHSDAGPGPKFAFGGTVHKGDDWGFPCCATRNLPYSSADPASSCAGVVEESLRSGVRLLRLRGPQFCAGCYRELVVAYDCGVSCSLWAESYPMSWPAFFLGRYCPAFSAPQ